MLVGPDPKPASRGRFFVALLIAAVVVAAWPTMARKLAQPLSRQEVATTWVGLTSDGQYLIRLVLDEDGTGKGGYVFLDQEPRVFGISTWQYESGSIEIQPIPLPPPPSWVRRMRGSVNGASMDLRASGPDWKVKLTLRREAELERRFSRLSKQMQIEEHLKDTDGTGEER